MHFDFSYQCIYTDKCGTHQRSGLSALLSMLNCSISGPTWATNLASFSAVSIVLASTARNRTLVIYSFLQNLHHWKVNRVENYLLEQNKWFWGFPAEYSMWFFSPTIYNFKILSWIFTHHQETERTMVGKVQVVLINSPHLPFLLLAERALNWRHIVRTRWCRGENSQTGWFLTPKFLTGRNPEDVCLGASAPYLPKARSASLWLLSSPSFLAHSVGR